MELKPYRTSYHCGNAYWMARLARAVYSNRGESPHPDEEAILDALQIDDERFVSVKGFDKNSAQAMTVAHEDFIGIAFRGTNELADWLDNINAFSTRRLFGSFHRGFYQSVMDVWEPIEAEVLAYQEVKRRPVWFTGHSLGGAMATVAAAIYIHDDRPFSGVYTFGQPRCMDRETSRTFNMEAKGRFFRFQNNNDIVTRVPARLMGYSHVGNCIYISEDKELCDDPGFWFRFLDRATGALEAIREEGIDAVEDHDMEKYLDAIEKWEDKPLESD